jgi:hypothetical protein
MIGRIFKYWCALSLLAVVTSYATAILFFRLVDVSFVQFATLVCVPLMQAVLLAWRAAPPTDALAALGRFAARHPLAQPVLVLDGLLLGAGIIGWDWHLVGFGADVSVQASWTMVKAAAVVAFGAGAVLRAHERTRTALRLAAPVLLMLAVEPSTSWLAAGFARAHAAFVPQGEVLQRLAFYGPLFAVLLGLTMRSARGVGRTVREAGQALQIAIATAVIVAVTVVLASYNLPTVTQPWLGVATLSASITATSVLLAAIFLADAGRLRQEGA